MRKLYSPNVTAWAATAAECFQTAGSRCKIEKKPYEVYWPLSALQAGGADPEQAAGQTFGFPAWVCSVSFEFLLSQTACKGLSLRIGKGLRRYGVESFIGVTALLSLV
ncbi:hypothetical protein [Neisseria musculi]|uniref:hypothetical protein n=1 Tax=Neisseria musculi TaxID=1815583 RepID=UPI00164CCB42|nr:hypothetical protein [Neisseria musculi]